MEIKKLNESELVLWSKLKRIKDNWFNAIIEKTKYATRNIQFIMKCNYNELCYIVVSTKPLTEKDIDNINLDDYVFNNNNPKFSKGIPILEDEEKTEQFMRLYKQEEIESMNYILGKPYNNNYFTEYELRITSKINLFDRKTVEFCKKIYEREKVS